MARTLVILLLLLSLGTAGPARADYEFLMGLGFTNPVGDLSEEVTTSFLYGLGLGIDMAPKFTLGAEIWNHAFSPSAAFEDFDLDQSILAYAVNGKVKFAAARETWYFKFLLGGYRFNEYTLFSGLTVGDSKTKPGFGAGLGYEFGPGTAGGFFEIIVNQVNNSSETATFVDFRGGVRFLFQ